MCGIVGGVSSGLFDIRDRLHKAIKTLRRRGPNDYGIEIYRSGSGIAYLGQTRLSIIDLSSAGHQPMEAKEFGLSMVFNGEIYNYRELRSELAHLGYVFHSDTDTEVLLYAWHEWGQSCLSRLTGMFAFAILDQKKNRLTCVRDPFGIKPLFYSWEGDGFLFASEIPAIKALRRKGSELNVQRSVDYLVYGDYDTSENTFFADIKHLLPGHILEIDLSDRGNARISRWWTPRIEEDKDIKFPEAVDRTRETFLDSIRLHLRSDVALGAALSGGIDSSAVACAIRYLEPNIPIKTFSYIAEGTSISEESWVDVVNHHIGAIPHKVSLNPDHLIEDLDDMILAQGEPFGSTSIYAQYKVFDLAKANGVTVTLDGQGADELLGGYSGYPGQRIHSLLDQGKYLDAWRFLSHWTRWPGRSPLSGIKSVVGDLAGQEIYQFLRKWGLKNERKGWIDYSALSRAGVVCEFPRQQPGDDAAGRRMMAELALAATRRGLPALLRHGDRNSMRFSIESRVPFLTTDLANLLLSMPESYLVSPEGETKHVFRAAMRGIVPDAILDRKDKIGFQTPEYEWLRMISDTVRRWLQVDLGLPFMDQGKILQEYEQIMAGRRPFSWQVWRWINFSRWYVNVFQR
jgi:asparagine synthase (glutamine-hydrolysing)